MHFISKQQIYFTFYTRIYFTYKELISYPAILEFTHLQWEMKFYWFLSGQVNLKNSIFTFQVIYGIWKEISKMQQYSVPMGLGFFLHCISLCYYHIHCGRSLFVISHHNFWIFHYIQSRMAWDEVSCQKLDLSMKLGQRGAAHDYSY